MELAIYYNYVMSINAYLRNYMLPATLVLSITLSEKYFGESSRHSMQFLMNQIEWRIC